MWWGMVVLVVGVGGGAGVRGRREGLEKRKLSDKACILEVFF